MPIGNLPVAPYDGRYDRDMVTGQWTNEESHAEYNRNIQALAGDVSDTLDDLMMTLHHGLPNVSHVATRETCKLTLECVQHLLHSVRDLLVMEAEG